MDNRQFWLWSISGILVIVIIILASITITRTVREPEGCIEGKECLTNILTGEKKCSGRMVPGLLNICLDEFRECTNPLAPYSYYDEDVGTTSHCPPDVADCSCVGEELCPLEISSYFVEKEFSSYGTDQDPPTSRFFEMRDTFHHPITRETVLISRPLSPTTDNAKGTCYISRDNIERVWPPYLRRDNRCPTGNLVYEEGRFRFKCIDLDMELEFPCYEPARIIESRDGKYRCSLLPDDS